MSNGPAQPSPTSRITPTTQTERRDGTFWVGSRPGGLHLFDRETGQVLRHYTWNPADSTSLSNENPWWILEDRSGDFWITSGDRIEGLKKGADDYLTKPFSVRELQARIDNLIAARKKLTERFTVPPSVLVKHAVATSPLSASDAAFLEQVRAAVQRHLSDYELSVESLAAAVNQSRSNLHRRLTLLVNQSPTTFIRHTRLEHSAALLMEQRGTISEVA